jgi:glycolate oxidase
MAVRSSHPLQAGLTFDWLKLRAELKKILDPRRVISRPEELLVYECDGLTSYRQRPALVVLPRTTEEVAQVVKLCSRYQVPFVARGSGTGLSGGALPLENSVVIATTLMKQILEIDLDNRCMVVQPGVINAWITQAVAAQGYFYAPDPSSQSVCSIGGNVAENSGGVHCLKYGVTANHILGLTVVLPDGEVVRWGGQDPGDARLRLGGPVRRLRGHSGHCHRDYPALAQGAGPGAGLAGGF